MATAEMIQTLLDAKRKIDEALPQSTREEILVAFRAGVMTQQRLTVYYTDNEGVETARIVTPLVLLDNYRGDRACFVWCHKRQAPRLFLLRRVVYVLCRFDDDSFQKFTPFEVKVILEEFSRNRHLVKALKIETERAATRGRSAGEPSDVDTGG